MATSLEGLQSLAWRNFGVSLESAARQASGIDKRLSGIAWDLYGKSVQAAMAELTTLLGGNGATLPGVTGSYWGTPDHASLRILGDLDLRFEILEVNPPFNVNRAIISKWAASPQQAYEYRYNGFGFEEFVWSTLGTDAITDTTGIFSGGASMIGRFTIDVANGANRILTWMYATQGQNGVPPDFVNGPWVIRQQKTVAGNTSIFAGNGPLRVGARSDATGTSAFNGRIGRIQLRNGIDGTIVANPDFRFQAVGATSFNDSTGKTWTRAGTATVG